MLILIIVNCLSGVVKSDQVDRYTIYSIVGDGNEGNSGDGGPPTHANIGSVDAIEVASNGDVYIADKTYHRIRKVSNDIISTIAGIGAGIVGGFVGDGGVSTSAKLNKPQALAINNADGTLYIGDSLNYRIRKISNQIISTVIGKGNSGALTAGTATASTVGQVLGLAVSSSGVLFFADYSYSCIGKISGGTVSVFAGTCSLAGFTGDNNLATSARLRSPNDVSISPITGELFIADTGNNVIRKVGADNKITTVVGTGVIGYGGDGGQATQAQLSSPTSITFTSTGEMFIADSDNFVIRKVSTNGIISTVAGSGTDGYLGDGLDSLSAQIDNIYSIAYSNHTNELVIADSANFRIRKLSTTYCGGVLWSNSSVCSSLGVCSYMDHCDCSNGYSGSVCQNYYCYSVEKSNQTVCSYQGSCISPNNCSCFDNSSWRGNSCEVPVCFGKVNGENGVCNNRGNCSSPNSCVCNDSWFGSNCEIPKCFNIPANASTVCSGRGSCISANNCSCNSNYYGDRCGLFDCYGIMKDNASVCFGHGLCLSPNNCSCQGPYYGQNCSSFDCFGIEKSNLSVCTKQGACISPNTCSCSEGFYGSQCNEFNCFSIEHNSTFACSSKGTCTSPNNCICVDGYYGNNCEYFDCFGKNMTDESACSSNGLCMSPNNCSCTNGYYGPKCDQFDCYGYYRNSSEACSGRGSCISINNCSCIEGYYSLECEKYNCFGYPSNHSEVCSSFGECLDYNNCSCIEGVTGNNCEFISCFGVSNTSTKVCSGNGECNTPNTCDCFSGYFGDTCQNYNCFGVMYNQSIACSTHGECISSDMCNCTNGYFGIECSSFSCFGLLSNDSSSCSSNGSCLGPNNCSCLDGYYGSECQFFDCFGIEASNKNTCSTNGQCKQLNSCRCYQDEYHGYWDGENCDKCLYPYFGAECKTLPCSSGSSCSFHGDCKSNGSCICYSDELHGFWIGGICDNCKENYFGTKCQLRIMSDLRFSDYGERIFVETTFLPSKSNVDCKSVISNVEVLGKDPSCGWKNKTFNIILGKDFTVRPSDRLLLNLDVLGESKNGSFIEMKVSPPLSPSLPIVKIEKFSICDDFVLDGSKSSSRDNGPIVLEWSVELSSDSSKIMPLIYQANNQSSLNIHFKFSDYSKGLHIFKLKAKSTLFKIESETMYTVNVNSDPFPPFIITPNSVVKVGELPLIIKKTINPSCLSYNFTYSIVYSKIGGPSLSFQVNNYNNLVISSYSTLQDSLYNFQVDLKGRNEYLTTDYSTITSIQTRISNLELQVVALKASSTQYTLGYVLTDIEQTSDVEKTFWSCSMCGISCSEIFAVPSTETVVVSKPINQSFWNVPLEISLLVVKGFRNTSSSIKITFPLDEKFGIPPVINILYTSVISNKVKKGELLNIQVGIQGVEDVSRIQRIWRMNGTKIDQNMLKKMRNPLEESNTIILDTQYLEEGSTYSLTLRVDDELSWLSSSISYQFSVLKFPKPCVCSVYPSFGYSLVTQFSFRCPNCETDDFDFEYGFIDPDSGLNIPIEFSSSSDVNKSITQYLPSSNTAQLDVYVKIVDVVSTADMIYTTSVGVLSPNVTGIEELKSFISTWTAQARQEKQGQTLGQNVFNSATISSVVTLIKNQLLSSYSNRRNTMIDIASLVEDLKINFITTFANEEIDRSVITDPLTMESFSSYIYTAYSLSRSLSNMNKETLSLLVYASNKCLKEAYSNRNIIMVNGVEKLLSGFISLLFSNVVKQQMMLNYDNQFLIFSQYSSEILKRTMLLGSDPVNSNTTYSYAISNRQFADEFSEMAIASSVGAVTLPKLSLSSVKPWSYSLFFINNQAIYNSDSFISTEPTKVIKTSFSIKSRSVYLTILNENNKIEEFGNLTSPIKYFIPLSDNAGTNSSNIIYNYECKVLSSGKIASAPSCSFSLADNTTGLCTCYENHIIGILEKRSEIIFTQKADPNPLQFSLFEGDVVWIPLIVMAFLVVVMIVGCFVYVIIGCCRKEKENVVAKPETHYKNFALNPKFAKKLVKIGEVDLEENPLDNEWEMQDKI